MQRPNRREFLKTAALAGKEASPHEALFFKYHGYDAVRQGRYKLIRSGSKKPFQLYDLNEDIGETTDLATEKPEIAASLQQRFEQWLEEAHRSH